jgi:SAM-dependent methyltransferase
MHLHDLLDRKHKRLTATAGVIATRQEVDGDLLLGVALSARQANVLTVTRPFDHPHLAGLEDAGFLATLLGHTRFRTRTAEVSISFVGANERVTRKTLVTNKGYARLLLPNALDLSDPFSRVDLVIEADHPRHHVFIGTSWRTPRDGLIRLAKGVGVEIGPGPRPQVVSGPDTQVTYIEEMAADEWRALYKTDVSPEAWEQNGYRIGKAHQLPMEDSSLDFIFSSHVLEHLYNPIGHFEHWKQKLKPGGLVLGVVPAADGTKDFVLPPTSIFSLAEEHKSGEFSPSIGTYEHWVRHHQVDSRKQAATAAKLHAERFSIHVHVYDYMTINNLLRYCVENLGYSSYRVFFRRNSKDFAFALKA